jgi:hypothetical protein
MPPTYTTSRDYNLLLALMPKHRLVCFVDYHLFILPQQPAA